MISSAVLAVFGLINQEYGLVVSALSVITATISGLIAILVLKRNADNDRPYIVIKPNKERLNYIQLEVKNEGNKLAIIEKIEADNEIVLNRGEHLSQVVINNVLPPSSSNVYVLCFAKDYSEKNKNYTTKGRIFYKDPNNRKYSNEFIFNIEGMGSAVIFHSDYQRAIHEITKIPNGIKQIEKELTKARKGD